MALLKHVTAQTDFSAGEVDPGLKRDDDHPARKAGLRQCANFRILNAGGVANRFGRSAQFIDGPRVDEVLMGPGFVFTLCFSSAVGPNTGILTIRQANGAAVFTSSFHEWAISTVGQIVWSVYQNQIFITFPGMHPLLLTWTRNTNTFAIANYAEQVYGGGTGQKRTFFYRLSPLGVTMLPAGTVGIVGTSISLTFSAGMNLTAGHIGTRMRYVNRQVLITAVADATHATATVVEALPQAQELTFASGPALVFSVGDIVIGSQTGAKGQVDSFPGGLTMVVTIINGIYFTNSTAPNNEQCVGPSGSLGVGSEAKIAPVATTIWDDELMNDLRGWPASTFVDQNRLGFCNFPALPSAVGWSAVGLTDDLYIPSLGTIITPDNAILELAPGKSQVYYVLAGAESDEFVFCDNATYWIPISATNPLIPGSVAFNRIDEGIAQVQPRFIRGAIIYVNAGNAFVVRAICATGAYNRPYEARALSELHGHLFNNIQAIAAPNGDGQFTERYFYVLNGDGTVVACKVTINDGQIKELPGWFRINGVGTINWISARLANVWFTTTYPGTSIRLPPLPLAELLDNTQYLDGAFLVNSPPSELAPPLGKGPLWWAPGRPVTLMDLGTRQMGVYQTDANGFIIPQFIGGENLTSPQLVAGQAWTATMEPFLPSPPAGQDISQRMVKRQVANAAAYVVESTGFLWARLFSGPLTQGSPALGDIVGTRRVSTYNMGDDATQPPPLREEAQLWRPLGASYDPRIAVIKDTSGPLTVLEIAAEITV